MNKSKIFELLFPDLGEADIIAGDLRNQISKKICQKRHDLHMSPKEFAKYMGVSKFTVMDWESCSYDFSIYDIANIFSKLNISFELVIKE